MRIIKRYLYYFFVFYIYVSIKTIGLAIIKNYPEIKLIPLIFTRFLGAWFEFFYTTTPVLCFMLSIILCAYFLNERKKINAFYSFGVSTFVLFFFWLFFWLIIIPRCTGNPFNHYYVNLEELIYDIIGVIFSSLLMIPIHSFFRKKFDFLNEAE